MHCSRPEDKFYTSSPFDLSSQFRLCFPAWGKWTGSWLARSHFLQMQALALSFFFSFHYLGIGSEEKGSWFSQLVSAASVLQHCLPSKVHQWTEKIGLDFGAEGLFWKTKGFLSASFEYWSLRIRPQVRPQSSDRIQPPCSSHYISQTAG